MLLIIGLQHRGGTDVTNLNEGQATAGPGASEDRIAPSAPDADVPTHFTELLRDGLASAMVGTAMDIVQKLPPGARIRFLAFMQMFEYPETIRVNFDIEPSGSLRLTLAQPPSPDGTCSRS
jgi:hypothetical protein